MHCLYCDRPLALLKRLTGDGEFCSKEHRKIYQQERSQRGLQRLLEAKQAATGHGKARPSPSQMPAVKPAEPSAPKPVDVAPPAGPQPTPAGFFTDSFEARGASSAVQPPGSPRFGAGDPVLSDVASMRAGRRRSGPRTAVFLTAFPGPRSVESAIRRQDGALLRPAARQLQLTESRHRTWGNPAGPQPSGAGFLSSQPAAHALPGKALRAGDPRFGLLAQARKIGAGLVSRNAVNPGIRPAAFIGSFPAGSPAANQVRLPDGPPRWGALDLAFPQREPAKIRVVLGGLLQRPVRQAGDDRIPETFEITFQPVSFPPCAPRMGCLEERLHRTDRIGFTPP